MNARAAIRDVAMLSLAAATLAWAVTRACLQSVTTDEAMTYRAFVAPVSPNFWTPHSNLHLLSSILIRLATTVFGRSQISLRLPALTGACVYIAACFYLGRVAMVRVPLRVAVFACLLLNPFVADLHVAARGYSFGLGFLMCAVAFAAHARFGKRDPLKSVILASVTLPAVRK